jgi:hypothetical protein
MSGRKYLLFFYLFGHLVPVTCRGRCDEVPEVVMPLGNT